MTAETSPTGPDSYFVRVGDGRFRPTVHTGGAWTPAEQHVSPLTGLITHELERLVTARGPDDLVIARIVFEILGVAAMDDFDVSVEVVRPGRTIELLEAVVSGGGRAMVRARAWRLARHDTTAYAGGQPDPLPGPEGLASWPLTSVWPGGYIASVDMRPVSGPEPGRATAWLHTHVELVAGEAVGILPRFITLIDTANGIAVRRPPRTLMFPSIDLTVHLHRQPESDWVGLDTTVVFGPGGQGVTTTVLHDLAGPVGRAEQILTVRPPA